MIYQVHKQFSCIISSVLSKFVSLSKPRRDFIVEVLLLYLVIPQRINFLQLGRYSKHGEQRFRQQYEQPFDFLSFNKELVLQNFGHRVAIAIDPSYITKSGKKTPYIGHFWSGCAGATKRGLEITGISAIDIDLHQSLVQTPPSKTLGLASWTLTDWYLFLIEERKDALLEVSGIIVADAYFSKLDFANRLTQAEFSLISRLRDDADLRYLYKGERTGARGAPKKYDGKINLKELDLNHFGRFVYKEGIQAFYAIVYSKSLKRNILLVVEQIVSKGKTMQRLIFSTELKVNPREVLDYYHARFLIEFSFRDAKQATGLNHSQARSLNKLDNHFNFSFTTVNIAKIEHWKNPKSRGRPFSITDVKVLMHNAFMINRFIEMSGVRPNFTKNHKLVKELVYYGVKAA